MLVQAVAAALLLLFLWSLLRVALGLRAAKAAREQERRAHEAAGRRVVAELPHDGRVLLFLEDGDGFYWAGGALRKECLRGARLSVNAAVVATFGVADETPGPHDDDDGGERWHVRLYGEGGEPLDIDCGRLREGVSREAAWQVFEGARAAWNAARAPRG